MLTGEPPHMGNSAQQIIMKIVTDTARPVTELRKSVPPNVAAAVAQALEKLPTDRFDSAKAFADALANPTSTTTTAAAAATLRPGWNGWVRDWRSGVAVRAIAGLTFVATRSHPSAQADPLGSATLRFTVAGPEDSTILSQLEPSKVLHLRARCLTRPGVDVDRMPQAAASRDTRGKSISV
jgi:hypothetical protein